jgi:hypothetical protein
MRGFGWFGSLSALLLAVVATSGAYDPPSAYELYVSPTAEPSLKPCGESMVKPCRTIQVRLRGRAVGDPRAGGLAVLRYYQ